MRSLADRYRDLIPVLVYDVALRDGVPYYSWLEVTPRAEGDYYVTPGARSGLKTLNWLRELNDRLVRLPTYAWARHRDEDGGTLHFEADMMLSRGGIVIGPPPGSPPPPAANLCLEITNLEGCSCLAGTYDLPYLAPQGHYRGRHEDIPCADGLGIEAIVTPQEDGSYVLSIELEGSTVGTVTFDVPSLPYEVEAEVSGDACNGAVRLRLSSGSCDGCDFTIDGTGKICFGGDVVIDFGNTDDYLLLSSVCPVFEELVVLTPDGEATIRYVSGLVVQRHSVHLPVGLVVEDAECRLDPADCCPESGGAGEGCCYPDPPEVLWASLYDALDGCGCLADCLMLVYNPDLDAWFSTEEIVGDCLGIGSGSYYLRLRCRDGAYELDVVDEFGTLVLDGVPDGVIIPSCDPFLVAATFADPDGIACDPSGGTFGYFISESDCSDGSGSGGGAESPCCPGVVLPETLYAHFSGVLADLGTVELNFIGGGIWNGTSDSCGGVIVSLTCVGFIAGFVLALGGGTAGGTVSALADSCDPLSWSSEGDTTNGECVGDFSVNVDESP